MKKVLVFAACAVLGVALIALRPKPASADALTAACPISLTNPDGQAMALVKYDLRAAVQGALSLVEMEMTFRNPEARQMEGRFVYTLPPGATISRFAKEVNGRLMEGEVVERLRAQAIYTEILHTMRDPALLESDQGNRFSARVFPVPANGTVRLLLAFSQPLPLKDGVRKLTIPLAGLPKIGEFNFNAIGKPLPEETGSAVVLDKEEMVREDLSAFSRHAVDYTPLKDIELTFKAAAGTPLRTLKSGQFQMAQFLYNPANAQTTPVPTDWVFYFDTSASGADTEAPRLQALEKLLIGIVPVLREKDNLFSAYAFDIDSAVITQPVSMNSDGGKPIMPEVIHKLRSRHSLGATDLEAALKKIGAQARASKKPETYVLVSDGIPSWGLREPKDLLAALGDWPESATLHALVVGGKQDQKILNAITEKTRGRIVTLPLSTDLESNVTKAIAELRAPLGAHFEVYDEGTAWIFPKSFHDVRAGTELIAFSEIKEGGKSLPGFVQKGLDGKTIKDTQASNTPLEVTDFGPLLQREAYKAYLDFLEKQEQSATDAMKVAELRKKRVEVSVKNRVLCPLTSLLVLETEWDYQRFGIQRTALADVMYVGSTGIALRKRAPEEVPIAIEPQRAIRKNREASDTRNKDLTMGGKADAAAKSFRGGGGPGEALKKATDEPLGDRDDAQAGKGEGRAGLQRGEEEQLKRLQDVDQLRAGDQLDRGLSNAAAAPRARALETADGVGHAPTGAPFAAAPVTPPAINRLAQEESGRAQDPNGRNETRRQGGLREQQQQPQQNGLPNETVIRSKNVVEWVAQGSEVVTDQQLAELRAKVQGNPHDRKLRNTLADALFKAKKWDNLQAEVFQWLPFDPENPAVYEFLGKSATGLGDASMALRAYSSIAEIAPNRAALLNRAGYLLLAAQKYAMAEAMFVEALKNRQDDANIHRGLAMSLWLAGNFEGAANAYETALMKDYNQRYGDVKRVLREEFGYMLRAWRKKDATASAAILKRAERAGVDMVRADALRVTMCWETDANDVDLHVVDPNGEECFYSHKNNASGLELYSDQTQGLGPEVIRTEKTLPGTYHIGVNYFAAGPMGVSRGIVVVFKPVDGVVESPEIVPFALVEGGRDLRYITSVGF